MKVLSIFDGISCARVALERAGIPVETYYASEIDKHAIQISKKNYPDILHVGDIKNLTMENSLDYLDMVNQLGIPTAGIDLLIGGSPCQDLSIAKKNRNGLSGGRSVLFWEYVRILKEVQPKYFILENVSRMPEESKNIITETLGVEPVLFNASLVSAQDRPRLFWTNIKFTLPTDKGICLKDILITNRPRRYLNIEQLIQKTLKGVRWDTSGKGYFSQQNRAYCTDGKSPTVPTCRTVTKTKVYENGKVGELHFEEMERLQGLPDGYTEGIVNKETRGGVIGNAFNVDVVAHILSFIPK